MSEPAAGQAERVKSVSTNKVGEVSDPHSGCTWIAGDEAGGGPACQHLGKSSLPHAAGRPLERDKRPSGAGQRASTPRSCRRPTYGGCAGPAASSAVDLLTQTRRGRRVALGADIRDRPAGASCRTGHRRRRPRRCSCCVGRCALGWDHGMPTDLARNLLSKHIVLSSPVSALGGQLLVSQAAPPNSPAASLLPASNSDRAGS